MQKRPGRGTLGIRARGPQEFAENLQVAQPGRTDLSRFRPTSGMNPCEPFLVGQTACRNFVGDVWWDRSRWARSRQASLAGTCTVQEIDRDFVQEMELYLRQGPCCFVAEPPGPRSIGFLEGTFSRESCVVQTRQLGSCRGLGPPFHGRMPSRRGDGENAPAAVAIERALTGVVLRLSRGLTSWPIGQPRSP